LKHRNKKIKKIILLIQMRVLFIALQDSYSHNGWISRISEATGRVDGVFFINANTGTVVSSSGIIIRTINGGIIWTAHPPGTTLTLLGISLSDTNTGSAVGLTGTILRTINVRVG